MKFISHLHKKRDYLSVRWHESRVVEGVRYATRRVSLGERIELAKSVRELALRNDFLRAGDSADEVEANLGDLLVRRLYLEWGLVEIEGLRIDGRTATVQLLIEKGPEALSDEVAETIRAQLDLSPEERKNS